MTFKPCLRSGFCCKQAPCSFGAVTSDNDPSCRFLGGSTAGEHFCMKYEEIQAGSPENGSAFSPAFGSGCCSPLNTFRIKLEKGIGQYDKYGRFHISKTQD